jgi:hypothetical protein
MLAGAVYSPPALSVPTLGFMRHVTPEVPPPAGVTDVDATDVTNCWVWDANKLIEAGLTVIDVGAIRVTTALAKVELAVLVALIVTVWVELTLDGAV